MHAQYWTQIWNSSGNNDVDMDLELEIEEDEKPNDVSSIFREFNDHFWSAT